jgi:hypothetical protein
VKIRDEIRKSVAFIGYEDQTNQEIKPIGSCFFLGHDAKEGQHFSPKVYVVTARHVIDSLRSKGATNTVIRLNPKTAAAPLISKIVPLDSWFVHPGDGSIDVAIYEMGISADADHLVLPFSIAVNRLGANERHAAERPTRRA